MIDFLKFGNGHKFDPKPPFSNHMCHWAPWAHHFQDDPDFEKAMLANMLGFSLEEKARLLRMLTKIKTAHSQLLWAYIRMVDTGKETKFVTPEEYGKPLSMAGAWSGIQQLNKWRKENRLNIKCVDVT